MHNITCGITDMLLIAVIKRMQAEIDRLKGELRREREKWEE
jgi:hypothetical protein